MINAEMRSGQESASYTATRDAAVPAAASYNYSCCGVRTFDAPPKIGHSAAGTAALVVAVIKPRTAVMPLLRSLGSSRIGSTNMPLRVELGTYTVHND